MLSRLSYVILRNFGGKLYPIRIVCFSLDGSSKTVDFLELFMTTVLFSAQQVLTLSVAAR